MKRYLLLIIMALLTGPSCYAACTGTGPWTAASPALDDVRACITAAAGCTNTNFDSCVINIPAGAETWSETLALTKGITLIGAGKGTTGADTIITSNIDVSEMYGLISYAPSTPGDNEAFRISNINLNLANKSSGIMLNNSSNTAALTKIMIDNSYIHDARNVVGHYGRGIYVTGLVYGVIYNNTFLNCLGAAVCANGPNTSIAWAMDRAYGNTNNLYIEDNTFTDTTTFVTDGHGGRWLARYNTFNWASQTNNMCPGMDAHGNQPAGYATMVIEMYGNKFDMSSAAEGKKAGQMIDHRGGKGLVFYNDMANAVGTAYSVKIREEYLDSGTNYPVGNPGDLLMHVTDSYYWQNKKNETTKIVSYISQDEYDAVNDNDPPVLVYDSTMWDEAASFDGTSGVGCGALTQAQLNSTYPSCTDGVGYWSTTQVNCADLSGWVGASGDRTDGLNTYIQGTLYKCSAGSWDAYYTPYTYPHPLREEGGASYFDLTATKPDNGTIRNADDTLVCGSGGSVCSKSCDSTTSVVLTFTADDGYYTSAITGCSSSPCTLAMSEARAVSATFKKAREATIGTGGTVTIGTGGTVTLQ